jgi:hypothetical protein
LFNLDSYIDSRRIKFICRIINKPIENWNAIGKYWLSRLDFRFNETFFICKCSNVSSLNLNRYPLFYQKSIPPVSLEYNKSQSINCFEFSSHMSWIVFILLLKNEENIKGLFWKVIIIQTILNKKSIPKCQDKWNHVYNEEFHWPKIWNNLKRLDISNKIKELIKVHAYPPYWTQTSYFSHLS